MQNDTHTAFDLQITFKVKVIDLCTVKKPSMNPVQRDTNIVPLASVLYTPPVRAPWLKSHKIRNRDITNWTTRIGRRIDRCSN